MEAQVRGRLDHCRTPGCGHVRAGHDLGGCIRNGCVCLAFAERPARAEEEQVRGRVVRLRVDLTD